VIARNSQLFAILTSARECYIFDTALKIRCTVQPSHHNPVSCAFSSAHRHFGITHSNNKTYIYDIENVAEPVSQIKGWENIVFHPTNEYSVATIIYENLYIYQNFHSPNHQTIRVFKNGLYDTSQQVKMIFDLSTKYLFLVNSYKQLIVVVEFSTALTVRTIELPTLRFISIIDSNSFLGHNDRSLERYSVYDPAHPIDQIQISDNPYIFALSIIRVSISHAACIMEKKINE
jgi:hypothetical protein